MNERIKELLTPKLKEWGGDSDDNFSEELEKFAELIVEETLKQVDERVYGRGENQWYYEVDKNWIRLHFGYGELTK